MERKKRYRERGDTEGRKEVQRERKVIWRRITEGEKEKRYGEKEKDKVSDTKRVSRLKKGRKRG